MNASEPIRRLARLAPAAVAFVSAQGVNVTFAQFDAMIDAVAQRIRALGLAPGHTVSLATVDLYRHLVMALALARVGVAFGPPGLPPALLHAALRDDGADDERGVRTLPLDAFSPTGLRPAAPYPAHAGGAATLVWYGSSGTTAAPRFTQVSHALAIRRADGRALGFARLPGARGTPGVRVASLLGPSGSYGFSSLLIALYGGNTVLEAPADPAALAPWIDRSAVTYLVASPAMLLPVVAALPAARPPTARLTVEVGGSTLPAAVAAQLRARLAPTVVVNYGATETGRVAWSLAPAGAAPAGLTPYPGVSVEIVDEDDRPVPAGEEGIVRIAGPQTAAAYLAPAPAAAAVFRGRHVYPGDRGRIDRAGALHLTGRVDDRINLGGFKLDPDAIESTLATLGDVREVAVFAFTDAGGSDRLCVAVVPGAGYDSDAYEARLREALGPRAPQFVMEVRALPRNANGKLLRRELAHAARQASDAAR